MGLTEWVAGLLTEAPGEIYECRECGTSLPSVEAECPYCGPTDVVRLELPE